jgi:hypothetical protein
MLQYPDRNGTIQVWDSDALGLLSEKTNAYSGNINSVAFSPDGTKIVSGSNDTTIKVWDSGAPSPQSRPPWPKLTPAGLSGRCAGAVEQEDERAQWLDQVGGIFPGRNQDRVRIGRQDDQSLEIEGSARRT